MSRLRVMVNGLPQWSPNDPAHATTHGYLASASRGGYALTGGELVQGMPGIVERDRQATRRGNAKRRST